VSPAAGPIGFVADDITGATDLASALTARGLNVRLAFGAGGVQGDGDAVVVALKIRSVPPAEARRSATEAAKALRAVGVTQLFFKYCSTFDSTADGNIGPIADALADAMGSSRVVHSPSYPANGRTVYLGHLFVGDSLLSESPLRNHPLNPMHDSLLPRVLADQTARTVGLITLPTVRSGAAAIVSRLEGAEQHVIIDAIEAADLDVIAQATATDVLAAGAAPYGAAFASAARSRASNRNHDSPARASIPGGRAAIVAGSLSRATREQVSAFRGPVLALTVEELIAREPAVKRAVAFAAARTDGGAVLISTDHDAGSPAPTTAETSHRIELTMGSIAAELVRTGIRRLVVAGGETSGAAADALALRSARLGPDIAVGVPWIVADDRPLGVAFKSGNFGGPSFFAEALAIAGP
jgi:3-dehydrotetronate 4-kinase